MEEDDSQDELINRSSSHNKGKRAAVWAISDDSDDVEEESGEGESDSDDDEEEDHLDGEDEDEEEEEEGNEDDEEDAKAEGAFAGTSADLADMSSDEDADKCPICLNSFNSQPVATPETCEHYFCLDCILEWAKNANSCPVDRIPFNSIYLRKCFGGKVQKMITVQKPAKEGQEETIDLDLEQTSCEVCRGSDREDRLLLCDGCDAGYHMECLTPPLDAVPVEEWFCPECVANNRHSRDSGEDIDYIESLPSTAHATTSRAHTRAPGPMRAIARTQQSERVRANVNRHRITQARSSQLAPTYLIQSTWLDETINAVVAGLNTAVYVRDFTPRGPSRRRHKAGRRRKVRSKNTTKKATSTSTGVRRRRRKVRRTKSRRKLVLKKAATSRSRIASSLGMAKDKKGSSLPTVYRPSEHTLSSMRADIGAASLSIYGDPFDLDPFVEREEEEQHNHVTSLLEAKRRGISRSALRSHQPVARPVTASLSRRGMDVPQSGGVVEAAPVPDLLGSILSGQSMLLMDSSDVVINRDGSLKAKQPASLSSSCGKSSSSRDSSAPISPVIATSQGESSLSPLDNIEQSGSSWSTGNRPVSRSASVEPLPRSTSHTSPIHHSDFPPRGHLSLQPPRTNRHNFSSGLQGTSAFGARDSRETASSSIHPASDSSSKNKATVLSQLCSKKASTKPMWIDVSVLPRIPKIKKESSHINGSGGSESGSSRRGNSSNSTSNGYSLPHTGMNSLAGDKNRQKSVEQQGRADSHVQRRRSDGAGSSSTFSNSFSSPSSATGSPAAQPCHSSFSSSSSASAVSFRINSSGNSWHSRRLSIASSSSSAGEGGVQHPQRVKVDEAKKRQLRRDKQMLLASRNKEEDCNNIYDPFNPTLSESSGSDCEGESLGSSSQNLHFSPSLGTKQGDMQSKKELVHVKTEKQEIEVSQKEPSRDSPRETLSQTIKVEKESRLIDTKTEKRSIPGIKVKSEPRLDDTGEAERIGHSAKLKSEKPNTSTAIHHSLKRIKTEDEGRSVTMPNNDVPQNKRDSSASSTPSSKKQKTEVTSDSKSGSTSPSRDSGHRKKTSKKEGTSRRHRSSSSELDRGRSGEHQASGQGHMQKERDKDRERSSRRSRSRERRRPRMRSSSGSSRSNSPERTQKKKCQSRSKSRSKERRRSRSGSSSSSRERSRKKQQQRNHKRTTEGNKNCERGRGSKDKRHGRSRSKSSSRSRSRDGAHGRSRSKSRSRSRSRDRRKDHTQPPPSTRDKVAPRSKDQSRHQSRSSSRERRKDEGSSQSSQRNTGSALSFSTDKKDIKKESSLCCLKEEQFTGVSSQDTLFSISTCKVKKDDSQAETKKITKIVKEIKKEKQPSFDMFEDSPISIKKEVVDSPSLCAAKCVEKVEIKEEPIKIEICQKIKTETCEIAIVKSEPTTPEVCHPTSVASFSTLTTPAAADTPLEAPSDLMPPAEQHLSTAFTSIKQEVQQPSDSDDDFNVDVMLDSLDYVKSEPADGSGAAAIKQEKDGAEVKKEGEQVSAILGVKSKSQVKRVTWNIQEPDGPQPEKSSSKLALYKLKLKQEGARRPSAAAQTTSQDITGPSSVNDPSKEGDAGPLGTHSTPDGLQPDALSSSGQGDTEEGDLLRKDKQYLKKLHMQERAIEEVKLAIKPFYQRRDIDKDEYKEILRKAVQKVCHSKSGEINPVKVGNLVKAYVDKYKHARKHKKAEDSGKGWEAQTEHTQPSDGL